MYLDTRTYWVFKRTSRLNRLMTMEDAKRLMPDRVKLSALLILSGLRYFLNGRKLKTLTHHAYNYLLPYNPRKAQSKTTVLSTWLEFMIFILGLWTPCWIECFPKIFRLSIRKYLPSSKTTLQSYKPFLSSPTQWITGLRNFRIPLRRWTDKEPWLYSNKNLQK